MHTNIVYLTLYLCNPHTHIGIPIYVCVQICYENLGTLNHFFNVFRVWNMYPCWGTGTLVSDFFWKSRKCI